VSDPAINALQPVVTVEINGRDRSFQWGHVPVYRLGCLTLKPKGDYATVIALLWASLSAQDAGDYPTPESLAVHIKPEDAGVLYDKVIAKIRPKAGPNAGGSKTKRSP
jgi:hypothetical protein